MLCRIYAYDLLFRLYAWYINVFFPVFCNTYYITSKARICVPMLSALMLVTLYFVYIKTYYSTRKASIYLLSYA